MIEFDSVYLSFIIGHGSFRSKAAIGLLTYHSSERGRDRQSQVTNPRAELLLQGRREPECSVERGPVDQQDSRIHIIT